MPLIRWVLVQMIGFISSWVTHSLLITLKYSAVTDLHNLHHTVAHTLGIFIFTSRLPATDLNTETTTVSHSKYYT
jgi:hypothetical protein